MVIAMAPHPSAEVQQQSEVRGFSVLVRNRGFAYLLERWAATVAEVESDYGSLFDEYLNDVDSRKIIEELGPYASDEEWEFVEGWLPALDRRFIAATRGAGACVWGEHNAARYGYSPEKDWWYYRLPTDLTRVPDPEYWLGA